MTIDEFARQQMSLGFSLHIHDGVWWEKRRPFYFQPAFRIQQIVPGAARPSSLRALAGYSHAVPSGAAHSSAWPTMIASWSQEEDFSLENLAGVTPERRSQVRRQVRTALRELEICPIRSFDEVMTDLREINIATAVRTGAGRPPCYYTEREREWRTNLRNLFQLPEREWWGAFHRGRLIAYSYGYAVGRDWIIDTTKSLSECMNLRPNDGLLFCIMERAINTHRCTRIIHGDWSETEPKLTQFKAKHGFERVDIPVHMSLNPLVAWARGIRSKSRSRSQTAESRRSPDSPEV